MFIIPKELDFYRKEKVNDFVYRTGYYVYPDGRANLVLYKTHGKTGLLIETLTKDYCEEDLKFILTEKDINKVYEFFKKG